jgi:hypothetical protein
VAAELEDRVKTKEGLDELSNAAQQVVDLCRRAQAGAITGSPEVVRETSTADGSPSSLWRYLEEPMSNLAYQKLKDTRALPSQRSLDQIIRRPRVDLRRRHVYEYSHIESSASCLS